MQKKSAVPGHPPPDRPTPAQKPAQKPGSESRRPGFVFTDWAMI